MITSSEKSQIKQLLQDPKWQTVERIVEVVIEQIKDNSPLRETNDETLREFLIQEGQVRGIRKLIKESNSLYQDNLESRSYSLGSITIPAANAFSD